MPRQIALCIGIAGLIGAAGPAAATAQTDISPASRPADGSLSGTYTIATPTTPLRLRSPRLKHNLLVANFFFHGLLKVVKPVVQIIPAGGLVHDVVTRGVSQFQNSSTTTLPPDQESDSRAAFERLEADAANRQEALERNLRQIRRATETAIEQTALADDRLRQELQTLGQDFLDATDRIHLSIGAVRSQLGNIDQSITSIDQDLSAIDQHLATMNGWLVRNQAALRDVHDQLTAQHATMTDILRQARASSDRLALLQQDLDFLATVIIFTFILNFALITLLLLLALKLERSIRYAIDLLKVVLTEFKIPIPDPPPGPVARLRSWCHDRRYLRWLPRAVALSVAILTAAAVVTIVLLIVDPAYGTSEDSAVWWVIGFATIGFLATRSRRSSDRLGPPVLALVPVGEEATAIVRGNILVRDNGLRPTDGGFVIGCHAPLVDVVVPDPRVSRRHARVTCDTRGCFYVEDLNSSNGTFVGDHRLQPFSPHAVDIENEIRLGKLLLSVQPIR